MTRPDILLTYQQRRALDDMNTLVPITPRVVARAEKVTTSYKLSGDDAELLVGALGLHEMLKDPTVIKPESVFNLDDFIKK